MSEPQPLRLNKYLADSGICSRRGADALILDGQVMVNGDICREPGTKVLPGQDEVRCQGRLARPRQTPLEYIMLHKPVHTVTTVRDPQHRRTVLDLLPETLRRQRLFPVGRLDYMSEGLMLLTNDGDLAMLLTHPRHEHPKIYEVVVREDIPAEALRRMRSGMRLKEGERLAPVNVETCRQPDRTTLLRMVLRQGINRQIRRMCRDTGLTILRLRRIALGPLALGDLPPGQWRRLTTEEQHALRAMRNAPHQPVRQGKP